MRISTIRHPEYQDNSYDFFKWRLCYKGGRHFIDYYLKKFDKREDDQAFKDRRAISYAPTYAKLAINKLKNTFYSRMSEIRRSGGSQSYRDAINAIKGGVDLYGCSMDSFIGQEILRELMVMKKVGVFIDRPVLDGNLLARNNDKKPYLYYYKAEDILTWDFTYLDGEYIYLNLLLRDVNYVYDTETGLVGGLRERYRHMWLGADQKVHIQFWIANPEPNAESDLKDGEEIILDLPRLPFVIGGLQESLLADVSDYQISLLNIASADINYVFKANFPFYTEQFDSAAESIYSRRPPPPKRVNNATDPPVVDPHTGQDPLAGTSAEGQRASNFEEIRVGSMQGRKYPKGLDRPDFIAPPSEPLIASMAKQKQMKDEIFELVDIAASQAQPQHASADSKSMDDRGLESGLSYIGLELEYMEREIAKIWGLYENSDPANIKYPTKYTLKSDQQRLDEAKGLDDVKTSAPSRTFAKEVGKRIAHVMLEDKVDPEVLVKIDKEIDDAEYISSDPKLIQIASELGMVDATTGSDALGFDGEKVVPTAQKEHANRLALIAASQSQGAARGVPDQSPTQGKDMMASAGNSGDPPAMGGKS